MNTPLQSTRDACQKALLKLLNFFQQGTRLTLIARNPNNPEAEFMLTQEPENLAELKSVIDRHIKRIEEREKQQR